MMARAAVMRSAFMSRSPDIRRYCVATYLNFARAGTDRGTSPDDDFRAVMVHLKRMTDGSADKGGKAAEFDRSDAERAYASAVSLYTETRRARIPAFIRTHFSLKGALRIHRAALGWDLVRAPANIALAVPHLLKLLLCGLLRRGGRPGVADRLLRVRTQLETRVEREIRWLIWTELLELPYEDRGRTSDRDALAEILFARPSVAEALAAAAGTVSESRDDPAFRTKLAEHLTRYTGARNATAEIATALASTGAGTLLVQQVTPTAISLGPPVAAIFAQQAAVFAFPLGTGLGGVWYSMFPPEPSAGLVAGVTVTLLVVTSVFAAFAGVVADPVQRALGFHRRRLDAFVEAVAADLAEGGGNFRVRAHYVVRLFDFFEAVRLAVRAAT
jgi:hypothetical protein